MVLNFKFKMPSMKIFYSKTIILIACILTFLYLVELCLGIRLIFYAFQLFKRSRDTPSATDDISWTIIVTTLLLSVTTFMSVSFISLYWDCKNTTSVRSSIYNCCHIITGGVLWRYVGLFKCDNIQAVKEQAMLLSSLKFLFTQTYTMPLIIIHIFLHNNPYEFLYDMIMFTSVTTTLVLTCAVFNQYEECGEYPYQTMALVPLLFRQPPSDDKKTDSQKTSKDEQILQKNSRELMWRTVAATQSIFFSLGRSVALGVLLKLAGIYAITIIFLQMLISVLYLKFQAVNIIPETLSKSKQLIRLAFLSYVLVFDWQLQRDTSTGYNLGTRVKHGMLYYTVATLESVFYLVTWVITENQSSLTRYGNESEYRYQYVLILCSVGCVCLVTSYAIHVSVILFKFCRATTISKRSILNTHIQKIFGRFSHKSDEKKVNEKRIVPTIDISSFCDQPGDVKRKVTNFSDSPSTSPEASYGSYRDLKENINYDAESKSMESSTNVDQGNSISNKRTKLKAPDPPTKKIVENGEGSGDESKKTVDQEQAGYHTSLSTVSNPSTVSKIISGLKNVRNNNFVINSLFSKSHVDKSESVSPSSTSSKWKNVTNGISSKLNKFTAIDVSKILSKKKVCEKTASGPDIKIPTVMNEYEELEISRSQVNHVNDIDSSKFDASQNTKSGGDSSIDIKCDEPTSIDYDLSKTARNSSEIKEEPRPPTLRCPSKDSPSLASTFTVPIDNDSISEGNVTLGQEQLQYMKGTQNVISIHNKDSDQDEDDIIYVSQTYDSEYDGILSEVPQMTDNINKAPGNSSSKSTPSDEQFI